jgi:hypothetical protein
MKILHFLCSRHYCPANIPQLNSSATPQPPLQSSTELPTFNWAVCPRSLIYNHCALAALKTSLYCCVRFSAATRLPSRCLETDVYLFAYYLAAAIVVCFEIFAKQRVCTPQYNDTALQTEA